MASVRDVSTARPEVFRASGLPRLGWQRSWTPAAPRRRRLLAAALAVVAGLVLLSSARPGERQEASPPPVLGPATDEVAAPLRLADAAVAALLHPGARIDVLAVAESPTGPADATGAPASVVATAVRVLSVPAADPGAGGGSLVVLAVTPDQALALIGAQASGRLAVTLVG